MFLVERVSNKIGHDIAASLKLDKDHEEVIAYGTFNLLHTLTSIILVVVFGFIFHVIFEALIISFTVSILRKYSGGVHATSPNRCAFIGTCVCCGLALLVVNLLSMADFKYVILITILGLIFCYYMIYKYAPVDSSAKPIVSDKKKQRLKRCSIITVSIMSGTIILLFLLYNSFGTVILLRYAESMSIGIVWQTFTLTYSGHKFICKVDAVFNTSKKEEML